MKAKKVNPKHRRSPKPITVEEFDAKFDAGEDISEYFDFENVRVFAPGEDDALNLTPQKVNVDFPSWVVSALDREANRIGIARQALIKTWIVERLELAASK